MLMRDLKPRGRSSRSMAARRPIGHGSNTDTDAVTDTLTGDLATAEAAGREPWRQGAGRKAVPLTMVSKAVAAMQAEGGKVSDPRLAERLDFSTRSRNRRQA